MRQSSGSGIRTLFLVLIGVAVYVQFQNTPISNKDLPAVPSPTAAVEVAEKGTVGQDAWNRFREVAQRGDQARHAGQDEEAERLYSEALTHASWHPVWNNRAWLRCLREDYEGALMDAQMAIDGCKNDPEALKNYHHTKATALRGLGRTPEALEAVETSLQYDPNFSDALQLKAELLRQ